MVSFENEGIHEQVALNTCHLLLKLVPHRLVDVVDIELRGGVSDKAFEDTVKVLAPAFGTASERATPISANRSGSTLVRVQGCRAPAPPGAWSGFHSSCRWRVPKSWKLSLKNQQLRSRIFSAATRAALAVSSQSIQTGRTDSPTAIPISSGSK
jgi:hypothetical protein